MKFRHLEYFVAAAEEIVPERRTLYRAQSYAPELRRLAPESMPQGGFQAANRQGGGRRRFDVELLALLVTDHTVFLAAVPADTLLRGAGDDLFDAR
jgi:hypothetical protein